MDTLIRELKRYYKNSARAHLPWRRTHDPYFILVSEIMLQQTQVERVIPFYNKFIRRYPSARVLARAPLSDVLRSWQGLGYNRRAKFLHNAAKVIVHKYDGKFPADISDIENLPGVGSYTARAIRAFAFNKREVFVETNIRTVFFHFVYPARDQYDISNQKRITDTEVVALVERALNRSKMSPRDFYAALMDYGAFLKASGINLNSRSEHYVKQPKFAGSPRQLRGALLRELLHKPATLAELTKNLHRGAGEVRRTVAALKAEGLLRQSGRVLEAGDQAGA